MYLSIESKIYFNLFYLIDYICHIPQILKFSNALKRFMAIDQKDSSATLIRNWRGMFPMTSLAISDIQILCYVVRMREK